MVLERERPARAPALKMTHKDNKWKSEYQLELEGKVYADLLKQAKRECVEAHAAAGDAAALGPDEVERELLQIFEQHNPAKVPTVPQLMVKHEGKEDAFLKLVRRKYGWIPELESKTEAGLVQLLEIVALKRRAHEAGIDIDKVDDAVDGASRQLLVKLLLEHERPPPGTLNGDIAAIKHSTETEAKKLQKEKKKEDEEVVSIQAIPPQLDFGQQF